MNHPFSCSLIYSKSFVLAFKKKLHEVIKDNFNFTSTKTRSESGKIWLAVGVKSSREKKSPRKGSTDMASRSPLEF
jgi:hypothetical protein